MNDEKDTWNNDCRTQKGARHDSAGIGGKDGVTDKAVSKWERDLSCPDINSIPNLAEILGVSVEELMQTKKEVGAPVSKVAEIMEIAPKAVAMAMGIAVTVLTILNALDIKSGLVMLGIGLACAGISLMNDKK